MECHWLLKMIPVVSESCRSFLFWWTCLILNSSYGRDENMYFVMTTTAPQYLVCYNLALVVPCYSKLNFPIHVITICRVIKVV